MWRTESQQWRLTSSSRGFLYSMQFTCSVVCGRDGTPLNDDEIAGMLIGLLLAGQHTSSTTSAWMGFFLAKHKSVQDQCFAEQKAVCGEDLLPFNYEQVRNLLSVTTRDAPIPAPCTLVTCDRGSMESANQQARRRVINCPWLPDWLGNRLYAPSSPVSGSMKLANQEAGQQVMTCPRL